MSDVPKPRDEKPPTAFISYSWESESHRQWISDLASRLRFDGVEALFDGWRLHPGDQLPAFMESAVRDSDFVLVVCSPHYKARSDGRIGGVGYEGHIITGELFTHGDQRKFIPLLRRGEWPEAAPSWMLGKYFIDFRGEPYAASSYGEVIATLRGTRSIEPAVRTPDSERHLSPVAATRQQVYSDFLVCATALFSAANKRFVIHKAKGAVAAILSREVKMEVEKHSGELKRLLSQIQLLSSEPVAKAAASLLLCAFAADLVSVMPSGEAKFREFHKQFSGEAIPKLREALREEADLR